MEDLAKLARIELGEDEKKDLLSDMKGILEYVKQIEMVKVPARNATHSVAGGDDEEADLNITNVWREDLEVKRDFSEELIKKQFPDSQDGFLKVKKIL